ncbi:MAG: DUF4831 family protein [Muribaculaceae bacterium]|nr:DUF4831 family protein [Muribaculaceae bacterium]
MKKLLSSLLILSSLLPSAAQQTKILTAEKHNEYGLVYTLPRTGFQIDVVALKETKVSGPFYKYSKIFTSDANVISEDAEKWTIESVRITPFGSPDPDNRFLMQLKAGATTFISVGDDGMILSINKEVGMPVQESINVTQLEGVKTTGKEYLNFVDEDFISAQSSYKQAQLLAEELMEIREAKVSLTRGTAETMPTDGRQLEIMLASLENQEKALMNAFTGSSWKERVVRTFTYIPEDEGKTVLFRLSETGGVVDANDYSGEPVYISLKMTEEAEIPVDAKGEPKKLPKDAVVYCIPGAGKVTVSYLGKNLAEEEFPMSQFGMLFGLNPSIFTDKKEPSYAVFNTTTGALEELGTMK